MPKEDSSSSWHLYFSSRSLIASSRISFCRLSNWAARILISLIKSVSRVVLYILRLLILYYTSIEISVTIRITLEKNRRLLRTARRKSGGNHGTKVQKQLRGHIITVAGAKKACGFGLTSGTSPIRWSEPRICHGRLLDTTGSLRSGHLLFRKIIPCTHNCSERDPDIVTR